MTRSRDLAGLTGGFLKAKRGTRRVCRVACDACAGGRGNGEGGTAVLVLQVLYNTGTVVYKVFYDAGYKRLADLSFFSCNSTHQEVNLRVPVPESFAESQRLSVLSIALNLVQVTVIQALTLV